MGLAGFERCTDADYEGGAVLFQVDVLPLLGAELRIHILQLLGGDKADLTLQLRQHRQLGVNCLHGVLGVADSGDDIHNRELQVVQVPVLLEYHLFPVPLVNIDGVEVVQLVLVPADGVHIGINALAGVKSIALESQTLPLGQGLDHLGSPV